MSGRKSPILQANGKPYASAWDASGQGRRAKHWQPTTASINALLGGDVATLRARSRDEVRRNPWARKAIENFTANLVGNGIRPKPNTDDRELKEEILEAFHEWADECDADGTSSFWGLQELITRSWAEGGDCFIRFRDRRPSDGLSVPLQIQALEAEMVEPTKTETAPNGNLIRSGIEFDRIGKRRAYWMYRFHPGESLVPLGADGFGMPVRVSADQVMHVYHVLRPGQVRGVPGLATVLAMLHEIREVDDAHVAAEKIRNLYVTYEETPDEEGSVLGKGEDEDTDEDDTPQVTAESGSHIVLPPGHKFGHTEPPQGASNYADFIKVKLRAVAAGAGVTYEQVSGDLSSVNFSSIRAGLVEVRRELEQLQRNILIFQFCRPVWRRWLQAALLSGRIRLPEGANLRRLLRARWQPPGFEYVDPEKEVRAAVRKIRAGLSTREIEAGKLGVDVEDIDRQLAAERAREEELGLVLTSNPRLVSDSGVGQARDPERLREEGDGGTGGDGEATGEEDEDAA